MRRSTTFRALATGALLAATLGQPAMGGYVYRFPMTAAMSAPAAPASSLDYSETAVNFGPLQVGQFANRAVVMTNNGATPVAVASIAISGEGFNGSHNCPGSLGAGASCAINVGFAPTSSGAKSGDVTVDAEGSVSTPVSLAGEGRAPSATLTPPTYTNTTVGTPQTQVARLTNTGVGPLTLTTPGFTSVSPLGTWWLVSTACGAPLDPGASCDSNVRFNPPAGGSYSGTFTINTSAGSQVAPLSGYGLQGKATPSATSLQFTEPVQIGQASSSTQSVTFTNDGNAELTIRTPYPTSDTDFAVTHDCGTSLAVNASCSVTVRFQPSSGTGTRTTNVRLYHNGPAGSTGVSVSGEARSQQATLGPESFGNVPVGNVMERAVVLANTGVGPLTVSPATAAVTGTDFSYVSTTCGTSVPVGGTCTALVRFSPTAATSRTGEVSVSTGAGNTKGALTGSGVSTGLVASVPTIDFGSATVGQSANARTVTLTNTTGGTVTVSSVSISSGTSDFAQSNNCGAPLGGGASCTVAVSFTPSAAGTRSGAVLAFHDGNGGQTMVPLTGTGLASAGAGQAQFLFDPSSHDFGTRGVGTQTQRMFVLRNVGTGASGPLNLTYTGNFSVQWGDCPTQGLAAGQVCSGTVIFWPQSAGYKEGRMTATAGGLSLNMPLVGRGQ